MSPDDNEEYREAGEETRPGPGGTTAVLQSAWWVGGWISPVAVVAFTILWTLIIYLLIGTRPRDWQYGTVPFIPGQSIFSVEQPLTAQPPKQVVYPEKATGGPSARP